MYYVNMFGRESSPRREPIWVIIVNLKSHLDRLKAIETLKTEGAKREVPSMDQLSRLVGIHRGTLNRIANNHTKAIRFELLNSIIEELQKLGFETDVKDILIYQKEA